MCYYRLLPLAQEMLILMFDDVHQSEQKNTKKTRNQKLETKKNCKNPSTQYTTSKDSATIRLLNNIWSPLFKNFFCFFCWLEPCDKNKTYGLCSHFLSRYKINVEAFVFGWKCMQHCSYFDTITNTQCKSYGSLNQYTFTNVFIIVLRCIVYDNMWCKFCFPLRIHWKWKIKSTYTGRQLLMVIIK